VKLWTSSGIISAIEEPQQNCLLNIIHLFVLDFNSHKWPGFQHVTSPVKIFRQIADMDIEIGKRPLQSAPWPPSSCLDYGVFEGVPSRSGDSFRHITRPIKIKIAARNIWGNLMKRRSKFLISSSVCLVVILGFGASHCFGEYFKDMRKDAEQGNAQAQFALGRSYYLGEGFPQNLAEAVKWFQKAAEQGDPVAQYHLAWMYAKGEGVPKNLAEAVKWDRKAAEQGDEDAQSVTSGKAGGLKL
jgi:hypothetical protein